MLLLLQCIGDVRYVEEKRLLRRFYEEMALDDGKFCFTAAQTMQAVEMGAVETLVQLLPPHSLLIPTFTFVVFIFISFISLLLHLLTPS